MTQYQAPLVLVGRILLALMFVLAGYQKIGGYSGTQQYMEAFGVPGILLPVVILVELVGGLMIVAGFMTRCVSLAIAGFTLVAAFIFHSDFSDQTQMLFFLKNLSVAGGFLVLAAHGAGAWSVDAKRKGAAA